jgi:hypothetical protein
MFFNSEYDRNTTIDMIDMIWFDLIWFDLIWFDMIIYLISQINDSISVLVIIYIVHLSRVVHTYSVERGWSGANELHHIATVTSQ